MTEPDPTDLDIVPPRRRFFRNLSVVWIVPLLALVLSLGVAWKSFADRGPLITITFQNAGGITAGETTLRYRDVIFGTVERVRFSPDLKNVIVEARITQTVADTLAPDAEFWVVRPSVTAQGVSGLSTVLSGVYIEGAWTPTTGSTARTFTGKEDAPLVQPGRPGTRITIRARDDNQLVAGAPVFYRGVEVGNIETPHLSEDGSSVVVDAFVAAPHDKRLTTASRFWDLSGFSVSLGAAGLKLDVGSLAALVTGGIEFDTVLSNGAPVTDQTVFDLFPDEASARESVFTGVGSEPVKVSLVFDGTVSGLTTGAEVRYKGLKVGTVSGLGAFIDDSGTTPRVRLRATVDLDPNAFGLPEGSGEAELVSFLKDAVARGLRARLATTSIFSSGLVVELVEIPDAAPASVQTPQDGFPVLPTVASDFPDFTATAQGVLDRINKLPVEEVMNHAISLMASVEALTGNASTQAVPDEVLGLIKDGRQVVSGAGTVVNDPALQQLPAELSAAVADLRDVVAQLKAAGAIDNLVSALQSADTVAANLATTSERFPELADNLNALAAKANALPAEELVASANRLLASANDIVGDDATRALPKALGDALAEVQTTTETLRGTLTDLRDQGAIDKLVAAIDSANTAAESVTAASDQAPALIQDLRDLAAKANGLPAQELIDSTTRLVDSANALIDTDAARALPADLSAALNQVQGALADLRAGGAVDNLNGTLASTRAAADSVAEAARNLPELADRLDSLATQAGGVIASYGARSDFNAETLSALREVQNAARAVAQLARTIERNPNSLLLGR